MSTAVGCFENVFGLSRTDCECFGTPPTDFDVSASQEFLDETPGINLEKVFAVAGCMNTGWEIMTKARAHGVKAFTDRVLRELRMQTRWRRQPVTASIGDISQGTATVKVPKTYHGMEVMLAAHKGGIATLKRIGMYVKFTGSVDILVFKEGDDTPIHTFAVSATTNALTWTDIDPTAFDMDAQGFTGQRFWFLWQPSSGNEALNSRIHCGCSGTPVWSCSSPWWVTPPEKKQEWYRWAMANGTYGDDLTGRTSWTHNNATQGLLLDFDFKCDARTSICYGEPDYLGDPIQSAFALGARYEAALWIMDYISGSTKVNREAISGGDEVQLAKVGYQGKVKEFAEFIGGFLAGNGEDGYLHPEQLSTYSDCFTCHNNGPTVKTISA